MLAATDGAPAVTRHYKSYIAHWKNKFLDVIPRFQLAASHASALAINRDLFDSVVRVPGKHSIALQRH